MRIIAGKLKGRKLAAPMDKLIRPTSDKVKEALFSMVGPDLDGTVVIDLFCGTGSLGLEAVSRGADIVYFGEKSKTGIQLTEKNISLLGVKEHCIVIRGDWEQVLSQIPRQADLIFLDPPYKIGFIEECLERIGQMSLLADGGVISAEHGADQKLPEQIGSFMIIKEKKYGNTVITLYSNAAEEN